VKQRLPGEMPERTPGGKAHQKRVKYALVIADEKGRPTWRDVVHTFRAQAGGER
jgi:hypothetical protein